MQLDNDNRPELLNIAYLISGAVVSGASKCIFLASADLYRTFDIQKLPCC